jgi:LysM domain
VSIDLESRLHSYGVVLDAAIDLDLASADTGLVGTLDDEIVARSVAPARPRAAALVSIAVAGLLIGGCFALLADRHPESLTPGVESSTESLPAPTTSFVPTTPSYPTTTAVPADDPDTWDPIRVAPGTVGWYEFGDVPAALAPRLSDVQSWTTDYAARFFRCATFTVDSNGPICTGLIGGNFVAPTTFAGTGELGTHLGDISTAELAWTMAQGSLWSYDEVTAAPPATPVAVGDHSGLMYSNPDTSYLVWEQATGVHLWIRATGFSTDDMVALALAVRPAPLPDHLPIPIVVDSASPSGTHSFDELVIGSHHGIPQCAQINIWDGCVSLPPISDVAMVVGTDGVGGPLTAVAAVSPTGSSDRLRVELDGAEPVTVEPVVSPLGFQYSIFRPGTARIVAAHMVAPDDSIVATATLTTVVEPTPTTAVGPSDVGVPGRVHPEWGSYVLALGDYPSTIAAKFKVLFEDLLAANGWTLVGDHVPEFPPPGTTIRIPPNWTEPDQGSDTT